MGNVVSYLEGFSLRFLKALGAYKMNFKAFIKFWIFEYSYFKIVGYISEVIS